MYSQMLMMRCRLRQCPPTEPWHPSLAVVPCLPPPLMPHPLMTGESAHTGYSVRVWPHTRDVLIAMHQPCPFQRQHTNTHANRCISPLTSNKAETMQLETTHGRDYPLKSAHINKKAACNKEGTVTRIATIDPSAADSVEALRCTSARNEDSPDARAEDDMAVAMEGEIMSQGGEGVQNRMAGGGAGQHTTQVIETLPFAGVTSPSDHNTWTHAPCLGRHKQQIIQTWA